MSIKQYSVFIFFLFASIRIFSQDSLDTKNEEGDIINKLDLLISQIYCDSSICKIDTTYLSEKYGFSLDTVPFYSDSILIERYKELQSGAIMPLAFNSYVRRYLEVYLLERRGQVGQMIGLSKLYYPMFEETLDRYNLPIELKHLSVVESALNPLAGSSVGAKGLWQFMYSTGKIYGLNADSYIDERSDPVKSTDAAARFFSDLYKRYNDWLLVIAAYNCGPGKVNRAIRRSGGKRSFWEIRHYLPRETRGYVPAFIAANYVMNYYELHNIYACPPPFYRAIIDTITIKRRATFEAISNLVELSIEELSFLNPQYKLKIIPEHSPKYHLYLPIEKVALFEQFEDSIYKLTPAIDDVQYVDSKTPVIVNEERQGNALIYTVKSGDNLGYIAEWYDCRAQDIRNWNNIYGSNIRLGQKLLIYVPKDKIAQYEKINEMSFDQKQAIEKGQPDVITKSEDGKYLNYKVKSGDSLWEIANKFPCANVNDIKRDNNLLGNNIKVGMMLKIPNKDC